MNPMTNVKNIQKLNERMLEMGVADNVSWHKQYKDSAYVFIGGLPYDLTEGDILCVFSQYGEIVNINLVRDKKTGKQKGFCFLCYEDQRSTILAVDNFNGIKLGGRTIRVDHCADYRRPKGDEKDEDGNKKEIIEEGCAPKTPSPPPSEDEEEFQEPVQKKKKSKKEKKHKKDKEKKLKKKEYSSESDSDHHQNVKKYPGNNGKMKEITSQSSTSPVKESRTAKDNYQKSNDRGDRIREWDYGKRTRDNTHDPSPPRVRKRDFEDANRARDYSHDGSPPRMRKKEWDDQKRTNNESSYPPDERKQRSYENRQYRSDDKDRSHYNRDEPDDRRDDGYGRSRRGDGYDERERDRSERKGNRR